MVELDVFQPGTPAVIDLRDGYMAKYTTVFRGFKQNHYLIVDHPVQDGRLLPLDTAADCVVRFISEGKIIGFRSRVISAVRRPSPLVFLEFPTQTESSTLRKTQRYPVKLDAVLAGRRLDGAVETYPKDFVLNLSAGGCLVEAYEPREKGKIAYLTVCLPEQGQIADVEVEVKRVDKKGDKFEIGLAFADTLDPNYGVIRSYLQMLEVYQVRT